MAFQLLVNFIIAILWMLFQNSFTSVDFVMGYLIGMAVVLVLIRLKGHYFYMHRVWSFFKLMVVFTKELTIANINVAKIVLSPKVRISPGIIAVPTELETDAEKTLFAVMMTLTPGTLSIEFSEDGHYIFVHCLNAEDKEGMVNDVKGTFETGILEVTRRHV
ncbi:Na+/H+ antiporter subunit E [Shouchella shacheensis]|uniref:Na+/H+ antiporter subunit E n=1 Tax=Shouchella shacheensis TaxID=1649580 RepID=UPI00074013BF|nr:Na+/H+ antiporter subunit E [Shouchella shacheensis]